MMEETKVPDPAANISPTADDTEAEKSVATGLTVTDGEMGSIQDEKQRMYFQLFEVLVLTSTLVVILALLSVLAVLFALPPDDEMQMNTAMPNTSADACSQVQLYTGTFCRDVLPSLQTCFSGVTSPPAALNIPSLVDQEAGEAIAARLLGGLASLGPSQECREPIIPFICLSIFGLCDVNNRFHSILMDDCLELRDNLCPNEWIGATRVFPGLLPICENLPDITDDCVAVNDTSDDGQTSNTSSSNMDMFLDCTDGFFFDVNGTGTCLPECGDFNPRFQALVIIEQISLWAGLVASVVLLILASTIQRKSLLTFPSVFFVYICIAAIVRGVVTIVETYANSSLFCGSRNFITAIANENTTAYCHLTGIVYVYSILQICMWMLLFAVILFWGVRYPSNFRKYKALKWINCIHIICVLLAVLIPLIGINEREGYRITIDSPYTCTRSDRDHSFFSYILPLDIILSIAAFFLVFTFWTIFQEFILKKKKEESNVIHGELKITILTVYIAILAVLGAVSTVYLDRNRGFRDEFRGYILCEGMGAESDCELDRSVQYVASTMLSISRIMLNFLPAIVLLICLDLKCFKKKDQAKIQNGQSKGDSAHLPESEL